MRRLRHLLILVCALSIFAGGSNAVAAPGKQDADAISRWYQSVLAKNWLIHIRLGLPAGWKMGEEDIVGVSADFPDLPYVGKDFAIISRKSEDARIAVFYYPIMGRDYYGSAAENFVRQYEAVLDSRYQNFANRNKGAAILSGAGIITNIAGKEYHILRRELRGFPANRSIYYYILVENDMKSGIIFALSLPSRENHEASNAYHDFLNLIRTHKRISLDPVSEVLSRCEVKEWLSNNVILYNAICDDAIRETEEAIAVSPDSWQLHYQLASLYSSRYLIEQEGKKPSEAANTVDERVFAPKVINYHGAVSEYRKVLQLIPGSKLEHHTWVFRQLPENLAQVYGELSTLLLQNGEFDEAILILQEGIARIPAQKQYDFWSRDRLSHELGLAYQSKADDLVLKRRFDLALENYSRAMEYLEISQRYSVWEKIGDLYSEAGDNVQAITAYRKAITLYRESNMGVSNQVVRGLEQKIKGILERH